MVSVADRLREVARTAEAVGSALDAWDRVPEWCEDALSRALVALEDVHRGLERTARRNENGPPGWLARSNVELVRRLASRLAREASERPSDVRDWMRFKVEQAATALEDCLRDLLSPSRARRNPFGFPDSEEDVLGRCPECGAVVALSRDGEIGIHPNDRVKDDYCEPPPGTRALPFEAASNGRRRRNPWTEGGWVEASAEVVLPDGRRGLGWDLGVFDPTDPATLTMDEIEDRLTDAVLEAARTGFVVEGDDIVLTVDGTPRRLRVVRGRDGALALQEPSALGPAPGLPAPSRYRPRWASREDGRRARRPMRNDRAARGPLEAAVARVKARLARAAQYERAALDLEQEILEDAAPFLEVRGACEEIQGLLPAGSRLSIVAGQAMRACGAPPRPVVPGEGILPLGFAESLLDRSRRLDQLQALIDRTAAASWRELAPWLRDEADCRLALGEVGEGVAAAAVAARIRDRIMGLEDAASGNPRGRRPGRRGGRA